MCGNVVRFGWTWDKNRLGKQRWKRGDNAEKKTLDYPKIAKASPFAVACCARERCRHRLYESLIPFGGKHLPISRIGSAIDDGIDFLESILAGINGKAVIFEDGQG